jgi:hypothetical protein
MVLAVIAVLGSILVSVHSLCRIIVLSAPLAYEFEPNWVSM